jgi:endonuclease III
MSTPQIRDKLVGLGEEILSRPYKPPEFTGNPEADALLNDLEQYPHAFVIACLMDRPMKAEKCWMIPLLFGKRVGSFAFATLVRLPEAEVLRHFAEPTPLHWMTTDMAEVLWAAVQRIGNQYAGDASRIWHGTPPSAALVRRFLEFKGAGPKIATMAANILVRELRVPVSDHYSIDISPDRHVYRVFERAGLVRKGASTEELIYRARELNPTYPGVFDLPCFEIGRNWCRPSAPDCPNCQIGDLCPSTAPSLRAHTVSQDKE